MDVVLAGMDDIPGGHFMVNHFDMFVLGDKLGLYQALALLGRCRRMRWRHRQARLNPVRSARSRAVRSSAM